MTFPDEIKWTAGRVNVQLCIDRVSRHVTISNIYSEGESSLGPLRPANDASLPLTDVRVAGEGVPLGTKTAEALIGGYVTTRLQYESHKTNNDDGDGGSLAVTSVDSETKLRVTTVLSVPAGSAALRAYTTVENTGSQDVTLQAVNSICVGGLTLGSRKWWNDYVVSFATSSWLREAQWQDHTLPSVGVDNYGVYEYPEGHPCSNASFVLSNIGTFSTMGHLPMGMLKRRDGNDCWLWQVEHNGSWAWEIGDYKNSVYVAAGGPNDSYHAWSKRLAPGEQFTSVPVALVHVRGTADAAFNEMNAYRRAIRRRHVDNIRLPVIFNDYMNCLMGDPTEEKVESLIAPARKVGAEYFCIDAGWYADDSNWWDDVGEYEPSKKRFPSGFKSLLDKIRGAGLIPGVWVEPEVVGIRSSVGKRLPDECFFCRDGRRVVEKGRFQFDFRHPAVQEHMDRLIDRLVLQYGIGYFKFDYNINVTQGTNVNSHSPGDGMLGHNRAYIAWVNGLYDRYPELVIESCSSGAQRLDYALLATHSLQSTSDQQDPLLYAAISAAMPTAVTPEQSASWAYPQPAWSMEKNAVSIVNSLLGRVHLSGRLDHLDSSQLDLVGQGMSVYKSLRSKLPESNFYWPLGLPGWHDEWISLAIVTADETFLSVWYRAEYGDETSLTDHVGTCKLLLQQPGRTVELLFPQGFNCTANLSGNTLAVSMPLGSARLFRLPHS